MKLHQLKPSFGSKRKAKIVGRGDASGHGSTSTRGNKGYGSRKGFHRVGGFEGGQMPLIRRLPKRGFTHKKDLNLNQIINLSHLNEKFPNGSKVTSELLFKANLIKNKDVRIKILGKGRIEKPMDIYAHAFSRKAKSKIENIGGKAILLMPANNKGHQAAE